MIEMLEEMNRLYWFNTLSIKKQDSYKRLINNSIHIKMSDNDIKLAQSLYEEELKLAFDEFFEKYCENAHELSLSLEDSFIAGCKFILNNKNQWM